MKYVAGIDGGQSATKAAVADERGRVLATANAGPADEIWQSAASTRMHDALNGALDAARRAAGLDRGVVFEAIVAGVSGYEGRLYGVRPSLPARRFTLVHDAAVAHAGAFDGGSGVAVIAGTGSIAYVVDDEGNAGAHGGLGYVFGDEGSAFWIAKAALAAAAEHDAHCIVTEVATEHFSKSSIREIFAAFYHGELDRERLAAFARIVIEVAEHKGGEKDPCALRTVASAHEHLARLACRAACDPWRWSASPRAAFVGGLTASASFKSGVYAAVRTAAPQMRIVEPAYAPVLGAVVLALREANLRCTLSA